LIATGNLFVWWGAFSIGLKVTNGARDKLITSGLYRFSRNPQYLADMAILIGFGFLFASPWVWLVVIVGITALALAPFAEEPWLRDQYGSRYREYCAETRRYL
jgi:protein-S-isoprenylcysteine O-methyltransferase Ste14